MELLPLILFLVVSFVAWSQLKRKGRKLAPGPFPLPIVGNILQLSSTNVHESLTKLSKKYGPVMSIRLGSVHAVVLSSPEMAKQAFLKQSFLDRPIIEAMLSHDHHTFSIGLLPSTDQKWKDLRKICQEQMFANHNLEKSQTLRHQKLLQLLEYLHKCCGRAVDIRDAVFTTTLNLMSVSLFSADSTEFDSRVTAELHEMIELVSIALGFPNVADYFPILKWFDPQGVKREADRQVGRLLRYMKSRMDERLEMRRANPDRPKPDDFLEKIVDIALESDYDLNLDDMLHLLFDIYTGGSETTLVTIEWAMAELLQRPHMLAKAKDELRNVLGDRKLITETEDIPKLPYLQGIVKEALRLHPPGPLSFPRKAMDDVELNGYFIPKDTQILVNVWGIARDPSVWSNPESFDPERYLNKNIEYKGRHFELLPFGSGKRMCPGLPVAHRIVHSAVAAMVHNFDWKFAPGESERNRERLFGGALRRESPLTAIPFKI